MPRRPARGDSPSMRTKEYGFPVAVRWEGARTVRATVPGKPPVEVATPPEFHRGADPRAWSPEDLLTAAAATCLAVTIAGAAEREVLPLGDLSVEATGVVGRRDDGRFGFIRIDQQVTVTVAAEDEERARALVEQAESSCLVRVSLDVEVETTVEVLALGGVAGARLGNA
jgi:organic hydroperoxide reductase OsmC/OhrA